LEGVWQLSSYRRGGGATAGEPFYEGRTLTIEGKVAVFAIKLTVPHDRIFESRQSFQLGRKDGVGTIDFSLEDETGNSITKHGIYEVTPDSLRLCVAMPGQPRPTGFVSTKENDWMLYVYKRLTPRNSLAPESRDSAAKDDKECARQRSEGALVP